MTPPTPCNRDRVLLAIILLAAVLGLVYNGVLILGKGPDEPRHMGYVRLLLDEHALPYLEPDPALPGKMREHAGAHTLHPPVYYLILLPFYALLRGLGEGVAWHAARAVSLLLCLGALPLIYQIALRAGGGERNLARLAVAQVGLLPIFGMTAGTINNDSATLLAVTMFLWLVAVKYAQDRTLQSAAVLGVCFGVGALCKATAVLCDGAALAVYLLVQSGWRTGWRWAETWQRLAVVLALVLVIAGPWYARNILLYHKFTPIEPGYAPADLGWLPHLDKGWLVVVLHDNFPTLFGLANWRIFYSMWSQKDWIPDAINSPVYLALAAYCACAIVGAVVRMVRQRKLARPAVEGDEITSADVVARVALYCPYTAFVINWLACLSIALFVHWGWSEGGRYLLPSLCGFSLLLARGWEALLGPRRLGVLTAGWSVALVALNGVTVYWLLHYLNPTFG